MNKEEIKKSAFKLEEDIQKIQESLRQIQEDILQIQTGDFNGPYWNGEGAYQCIETTLLQLEHDTSLLNDLEKKVKYIHTL